MIPGMVKGWIRDCEEVWEVETAGQVQGANAPTLTLHTQVEI
jgi:hypothetical protein